MAHEKSATVTIKKNGEKRFANIDTVGEDAGRILGGRTFNNMDDAVIEAQSRSTFSESDTPRNMAARKNPRDENKSKNPVRDMRGMRRPNSADD